MLTSTSYLVRTTRLIRLLLHFVKGVAEVGLLFPRRTRAAQNVAIRNWSRKLCDILCLDVIAIGQPPQPLAGGTLIVANHISWVDIFVLNSVVASRFVAKSEVRTWPIAGWLCHHSGTLFVQRERRHDTRRVNAEISGALRQGELVSVFPEGGTTDGTDVARFNASLLQPAIDADACIAPVAIRYLNINSEPTRAAAYVGEMSLLDSLKLLLAEPRLRAEIHYLPPVATQGQQRRELAGLTHQSVRHALHGTSEHHSQVSTRG